MVRAVMAEFQLERLAAQRESAQLVAETDAENRDAAGQPADIFDGVRDRLGIARAVREKNSVRLQREDVFGGGFCRDYGHVAAVVDEKAQDVLLDAVIVRNDLVTLAFRGCGRFFAMRGTISLRGSSGQGCGSSPSDRRSERIRTQGPAVALRRCHPSGELET